MLNTVMERQRQIMRKRAPGCMQFWTVREDHSPLQLLTARVMERLKGISMCLRLLWAVLVSFIWLCKCQHHGLLTDGDTELGFCTEKHTEQTAQMLVGLQAKSSALSERVRGNYEHVYLKVVHSVKSSFLLSSALHIFLWQVFFVCTSG